MCLRVTVLPGFAISEHCAVLTFQSVLQAPDPEVLRRVGEVLGLADGKVRLRWASGDVELVRPQVSTTLAARRT